MKTSQINLFGEEKRYAKLTELGEPLEKLDSIMDWEMFREKLTKACQKENYANGGRPPIDVITKFMASVMRRIYNLSFDRIEYRINDRLSFMCFLGIGLNEQVLDSRTIRNFENKLAKAEMIDDTDEIFYADSAYSSADIAESLSKNCKNQICEKGYRGHPLAEEQKESNRQKSKICDRIEHVFGYMTGSLHGISIRSIGLTRA